MMLASIDNDPLVYPTIEENGQTRPKKYSELTEAQQLHDDCDVQATNIILHGLPPDVYALINHQKAAKLYNLFDKFAHVPGEILYEYYWRFSQLINDIHTIGMTMQQVQVNTMFLNALPSEWSKFITDVKLAKSLYTTNYDQLYPDSLAFVANSPTLYNPSQSPQHSVNPQQYPVSPPPFISPLMTPQSQAEFSQLDSDLVVHPGISEALVAQQTIPQNLAFLTDDLDAYDSDCVDLSLAKAILMANISSYDPEVLYKAQRIQPTLYDGSVLAKEHVVIYVYDDEETLILEEESRSKMLDKKNDPISRERNIKISPIDYS
ncbi:hypothetical protein Tco_0570807 [Tanacetum coccineum]